MFLYIIFLKFRVCVCISSIRKSFQTEVFIFYIFLGSWLEWLCMVVNLFIRIVAPRRQVLKILSFFCFPCVSAKRFNDCSFVVVFGGRVSF